LIDGIQEDALVYQVDDPLRIPWRVLHVTVDIGTHRMIASLALPGSVDKWVRLTPVVPLDQLRLFPPDLEDWPVAPILLQPPQRGTEREVILAPTMDQRQPVKVLAKAPPKWFSRAQLAAIFLSLSLMAHGAAMLLAGKMDQAAADFAGALGTAGLPAAWTKGWIFSIEPEDGDEAK
jgi:hypothetical protein